MSCYWTLGQHYYCENVRYQVAINRRFKYYSTLIKNNFLCKMINISSNLSSFSHSITHFIIYSD